MKYNFIVKYNLARNTAIYSLLNVDNLFSKYLK